jgi:signal peptidase I
LSDRRGVAAGPTEQTGETATAKKRPHHHSLVELLLIVVVALGLALLIQAFLVKPYRIPSESMEPTLDVGQRVLVSRFNYKLSDPDRGDIVVFHPPEGAASNSCGTQHPEDQACPSPTRTRDDVNFIKRIVAIPGDRLSIRGGHAVVNGVLQKEDFTRACAPGTCDFPRPIKIPAGYFFMMGDNRGASDDSRFWGPVPEKWIIGQAFATYWPPKRVGIL